MSTKTRQFIGMIIGSIVFLIAFAVVVLPNLQTLTHLRGPMAGIMSIIVAAFFAAWIALSRELSMV